MLTLFSVKDNEISVKKEKNTERDRRKKKIVMNQPLPLHILHIIENPNDIFCVSIMGMEMEFSYSQKL